MTNQNGRFGVHGGQYIPETLMNAVIELEEVYNHFLPGKCLQIWMGQRFT